MASFLVFHFVRDPLGLWKDVKLLFQHLRCSDHVRKAAKTMAFYAKTGLNLLDVFMTDYKSIYYEKANCCC